MNDAADHRLRLTLRQLEVFVATARAGSTRAAASRLARSQSAASDALAELEACLGAPVFDRVGRRLQINERGRRLLPQAIALLEQAQVIESGSPGDDGPLHLAASFTVGETLLPGLIAAWRRGGATGTVRLDVANTRDVLDQVAGLGADIGFVEGSGTHPDLTVRPWRHDELLAVAAPDDPLARRRRRPSTDALAGACWILRERGSGTREVADRWLAAHLPGAAIGLELGSNLAVLRAVEAGLGVGCLSRLAVDEAVRAGRVAVVRTSLPPMSRLLSIVRHRARRPGPTVDRFLAVCEPDAFAASTG